MSEASAAVKRRFTENVISRRARLGLSQHRLAERAGLHRTEVALVERGLRSPRLDTIVKLAGALEVEPCELLSGMAWRLTRQQGAYVHVGSTGSPGDG